MDAVKLEIVSKAPDGTVWKQWIECSDCRDQVFRDDRFCRHCGKQFQTQPVKAIG